jgi:hypothetical protein
VRAKQQQQVILTFDSDFANILAYPPQEYFGIIRVKIKPPFAETISASLKNLFLHFPDERALQGKLVILAPHGFRIWEER